MNSFDYISINLVAAGVTTNYVVPRRAIYLFWRKGFWLCKDYFFDTFVPALEKLCQSSQFPSRLSDFSLDQNQGKIVINHDHKCIIDNNRYGNPFNMPAGWVNDFLTYNDDPYVGDILDFDGFKGLADNQMLTLHKASQFGNRPSQTFSSVDDLRAFLANLSEIESLDRYWINFNIPNTWSIVH